MDEQRSRRKGKPNCWVVIPIHNETLRKNLIEVQSHLEDKYKTARGELRKAFTDLSSNRAHVTLFGFFLPDKARRDQVKRVLHEYQLECIKNGKDLSFKLDIKGLGSWMTRSGNIVLYADMTNESREIIKVLAKEVRDYVHSKICTARTLTKEPPLQVINDNGEDQKENTEEEESEEDKDKEDGSASEEEEDSEEEESEEVVANRRGGRRGGGKGKWSKAQNKEKRGRKGSKGGKGWKGNNRQRGQRNFSDNLSFEEEDSSSEEEESENDEFEEKNQVEGEEDEEGDLEPAEEDGMWMDDPKPEIYMPHLTLMNTDPKLDKNLWKLISEGKGGGKKQKRERDKGKKKEWEREKDKGRKRKDIVAEQIAAKDPYGWSYSLMRDIRKEFSRVSFGSQHVGHIELQEGFECLQRVYLDGKQRKDKETDN